MKLLFMLCGGLLAFLPAARALTLPGSEQVMQAFAALDANRNRGISAAEWEKASFTLFRAADANNDNALVLSELTGTTLAEYTFMLADDDRNSQLSISEYMKLRRAIFKAADIDRDESLIEVEFELYSLLAQAGWTDRNNNGYIEPSELKASIDQAFPQLDQDRNGYLTPAELGYMRPAQFRLSDADGDDRLTPAEFVRGYLKALGA